MKKILFFNISLVISLPLILSACATKALKSALPPSPERMSIIKTAISSRESIPLLNKTEEIAKDYLEAMMHEKEGHFEEACRTFEDISQIEELPVSGSALVHALKNCQYDSDKLIKIWKKNGVANYLMENYLDLSRDLAANKALEDFEADFSYALIPFKSTSVEKEKLIKRSIEIAQKQNNVEKIKLYKEKLIQISPLNSDVVNSQNIFSIARDFESHRNFLQARQLYEEIIKGEYSLEEKVKAYNAYRTSFKVARDLKTFLEKTFEMEKFLKNFMEEHPSEKANSAWVDSSIALARAVWTDHRNSEARQILNLLISSKKGTTNQMAQAHYIFGQLHLENNELKEALKRFNIASSYKITDNSLAENIQWSVVWNSWLLKEDSKLQSAVDNFVKKSSNETFIAKLTFWRAMSLRRMGKTDEALALFKTLNITDPFGYYGIIATMEAKIPLRPLAPSIINQEPTGNNELDWLIALEEISFSQKLLKQLDPQFKKPKERERAMSLYYQTQWFQGGMRQIYNFKPSLKNSMTEKYINTIFPTPYQGIVNSLAQKYTVPKELIYSITRQESAFVSHERSWADAFGLMQIIPEKAQELSKKYGIVYHDFNDLYDQATNLEMGSALLKDLRQKFDSNFAQTVAAYNASESTIRVWEKERFNGNYIEFIEMIPYEETRNYIKLVFRNFITYKRLAADKEFLLNQDFFSQPFE